MASTAVLVIDMLNPYDHEDADLLAEQAAERIEPLSGLVAGAIDSDSLELIYVNDNFEDFTATSKDIGANAMNGERPDLVEPLLPPKRAYFVQKVRHSAFYQSALDHLLKVHEVETLVLSGQVTEQCILYTALDAYLRGFALRVAADAVVPIDPELGAAALKMMERNMGARIAPAAEVIEPG
jgi:nicotinamidase-related amidase